MNSQDSEQAFVGERPSVMTDQTRYPARGNPSSQARSGSDTRFSRRAEDPLAELARLIGQDDPFAEMNSAPHAAPSRSQATPVARRAANGNGAVPVAHPRSERRDDYYANDDYEQPADEYDRAPEPAYGRDQDAVGYEVEPRRLPAKQYNGRAYSYGGMPVRTEPAARPARPVPQPEYDEEYDDPRYAPAHAHDSHLEARGHEEDYQYDDGSYEGQDYASEYEQDYASDEEYAEPVRAKRRWMLLGVVSLIGIVILGISGIYGYRAIFKKHTASNPPTIRSAETPAKVAPSAAQAKPEGAKQNYDRIGETPPAGGERVVSREEQPAIPASPGARKVTTTAVGAQTANSVSAFAAPSQTPALTPPPSTVNHGNGEPRRVRTLTVRADGTIVDPRHGQAAPARGNAPLALNANAHDAAGEPTHAARSAAPSRTANYTPAGSYVVQVSSQKSEQDAQTAWRQLQAKYTNVLGNAQVAFKRVDLGDRGTFYRAMVGPFANRDQAYEMCQNLKTAGGECVVQRN